MSRIYTRTGDDGTTHSIHNGRLPKDDARIEAIGTLDELNSLVGVVVAELNSPDGVIDRKAGDRSVGDTIIRDQEAFLVWLQNRLFDSGGLLVVDPESATGMAMAGRLETGSIEQQIDSLDGKLPRLSCFILPGGTRIAAMTHLCRSVCRRSERCVVSLLRSPDGRTSPEEQSLEKLVKFLNRLSDYLFVLARIMNQVAGLEEVPWQSETDNQNPESTSA